MPELPEVETIARQLNQVLPGRVIKSVQVLREKSFVGGKQEVFRLKISKVGRKAKNIIIEFTNQDLVILIHLKMTGQLIFMEGKKRVVGGHPTADWVNDLPSKHTRVIIKFIDGSTLFFNDMRVFGWVKVVGKLQWLEDRKKFPPDVIDPEFTLKYLTEVLKRSSRAVKLVLVDQTKIGGLGNIYVNDALYLSHTKPTRKANSLEVAEIGRLHKASVRVIKRGIEVGGASENTYRHKNGMGGEYQEEFLIYKRVGERSGLSGCEGIIEKIKLGGRGTYYCPKCQQ